MEISEHLAKELNQLEQLNGTQHICKYRSVGHFVLENGRYWTPKPKPDRFKWQKIKNCYGNSTLLALENEDLIYCEGYALGQFWPMLHAWCITHEGEVIDTTWRVLGTEYFGIAIKPDYLAYRLTRQDEYGLIDAWNKRWPMLHDNPKLWRHPINDLEHEIV